MAHVIRGVETPQAVKLPRPVAANEAGFKDSVRETYGKKKDVETENKNNVERNILGREPFMNVIEKEDFDKRVEEVFTMMGNALAKSYGPYGMQRCPDQCPGYLSAFHRIRRCRSLCSPSRLWQCPLERHKRSS